MPRLPPPNLPKRRGARTARGATRSGQGPRRTSSSPCQHRAAQRPSCGMPSIRGRATSWSQT
eukprot:scaffold81643_cov41-Phaeocystis_antarctica.AAC.5